MELVRQILASFEGTLPNDSRTAAAIARGAPPEEISACASAEGLHALAAALFEACEEGAADPGDSHLDTSARVAGAVAGRLRDFRQQLPADCETARLIDGGAGLAEIAGAAQKEGLTSLVALLVEAEQEGGGAP